jgi:hypothetical protein
MRCQARTRSGVGCARAALRGERVCASHAGRCGARPGNRNAVRHGLYSRALAAEERESLAAAYQVEGLAEEIGVTRLLILRALRQPEVPLGAYAGLLHALCWQVRLQQQLAREERTALEGALGTVLEAAASELGLGEAAGSRGDEPGGGARLLAAGALLGGGAGMAGDEPGGGGRQAPGRRPRRRRAGAPGSVGCEQEPPERRAGWGRMGAPGRAGCEQETPGRRAGRRRAGVKAARTGRRRRGVGRRREAPGRRARRGSGLLPSDCAPVSIGQAQAGGMSPGPAGGVESAGRSRLEARRARRRRRVVGCGRLPASINAGGAGTLEAPAPPCESVA